MKIKRTTIKDVAREAGVSIATVSRILNGENDFPETTQKRIWDAAHKLNYIPSQQARDLRNGNVPKRQKTNLIMRIFEIGRDNPIGDRVTADSAQMFDWIANKHGFFTINYRYHRRQGFRCPPLLDQLTDGVIMGSPHKEVMESVAQKVPLVRVAVDKVPGMTHVPNVNPAVRQGLEYFIEKAARFGHKKAAIVGGYGDPEETQYQADYKPMILETCRDYGISIPQKYRFFPENLSFQTHERKMEEIVKCLIPEIKAGKVTLILPENMAYADTLYKLLRKNGVSLPGMVSMLTIDPLIGEEYGRNHPVTSVVFDWEQMFDTALTVLERMIREEPGICSEYLVEPILNEGSTLGALPSAASGKMRKK